MTKYKYAVLGIYAIFVIICIWKASLLPPATEPPSFVGTETNIGRLQALEVSASLLAAPNNLGSVGNCQLVV